MRSGEVARAPSRADQGVVVVGPAPPLRGGIAAHTSRLVGALEAGGVPVEVRSWTRLYPSPFFPGTSERTSSAALAHSREVLDVLDPRTWAALGRELAASDSLVVLQWWHPLQAAALFFATRGVDRERLAAVCHNVLPHESFPGSAAAARRVLGRCGRVVCHSRFEAGRAEHVLRGTSATVVATPLPCLFAAEDLAFAGPPPEIAVLGDGVRLFVAAGHLRPYKGIGLLLDAWLAAKRPAGARLAVVGESYLPPRERRRVERIAAREPSILYVNRYVGDRELVSFLAFSEALVAAHLRSSQSGLLPLARVLGVPAIVSNAGGLVEQGEGDPAWRVVEAGSSGSLAAALEEAFAVAPRREAAAMGPEVAAALSAPWQRVIEAMGVGARPSAAS